MKKWILVFLVLCIVVIGAIYLLIPGILRSSSVLVITCPKNAANRFLLNEARWTAWWPAASNDTTSAIHRYRGRTFTTSKFFTDKIELAVSDGQQSIESAINILPLNRDSIQLRWQFVLPAGNGPFERLRRYRQAMALKKDLSAILNSLGNFLQNTSNLYGFPIREIISKDSALVTARRIMPVYPDNHKIYRLVDTLTQYVLSQGARPTNQPMLKITALSGGQYQLMVAIPTNRMLPGTTTIMNQHFVPWKTLVATVTGGRPAIDSAFRQMERYVEDHQRTSMALPFESMVTNRVNQPDSTKWVTLVCQPVS